MPGEVLSMRFVPALMEVVLRDFRIIHKLVCTAWQMQHFLDNISLQLHRVTTSVAIVTMDRTLIPFIDRACLEGRARFIMRSIAV
jgi:hypothetical protein